MVKRGEAYDVLAGQPERELPAVSGVLLRALADVAIGLGVEPEALFQDEAESFVSREPVDVRISLPTFRALIRRAITRTGDPALGLRCALRTRSSAFDLLAPLVSHVPTLRHALRETQQFQALCFDGVRVHLSERLGVARIRCEFPRSHDETDRSLSEFVVASHLRLLRGFGCAPQDVHAAHFEHARPSYRGAYQEAFEGKECFSSSFTGIEFSAHLLDRPNLYANATLQSFVHAQAEQRLERLTRPTSLVERMRVFLASLPAGRVPDMHDAAQELGVSVRSLRRRLSEEGHSYRTLVRNLQRDRACAMLRNPDLTVQDVAFALGFRNAPAFHRAFKRWTGTTACEYRNSRREPGASVAELPSATARAERPQRVAL